MKHYVFLFYLCIYIYAYTLKWEHTFFGVMRWSNGLWRNLPAKRWCCLMIEPKKMFFPFIRHINEDENTDDEIERIMEEEKRKEEMQKQQNEKEVEKEKEKLKKKETDKKGERTKNNLVHNNDSFNESEDTDEELKEEAKEVGRRKKEKAGKSLVRFDAKLPLPLHIDNSGQ